MTQIEKSGASAGSVTRLLDETALAELFPGERTPQPASIASDPGALYVTINNHNGASTGGVLKLEKSTGLISVLAFDDLHPLAIDLDDQHVYYTRNHDTQGAVVRVLKEGGQAEVVAAHQLRPIHVFLTTTRVYWINRYGPELDPPAKSAELRSIAKP